MFVKDAVLKRRATKVYLKEESVNLDDIALITDAGLWAPTAANIQSSMILSVTNKAFKKELANYFDEANREQIETAQALFIFIGTPWKDDLVMKKMLVNHSLKYWNLTDDQVKNMSEGMVSYYNNVSEYKEHLDITAAGTQLGMMMLQATELGYDSNGMIGIKKTELTRFLQTKKIINEYQTVNLALSIGHRDENHDKNKILTHNRIQKELLVKEFD